MSDNWALGGSGSGFATGTSVSGWDNGTFVQTKGFCSDVFFSQAMRWMRQGRGRHLYDLSIRAAGAGAA